ncbi:MAG: TetR/AcrR family transcriptional regulator [Actinobacteria bacterium]|nr:TetR/AcrR family transcriptional regulator [Actinomycetota bacterium]
MVKRRGWNGSPPADDAEARERVVEAAMRVLDECGPEEFTLARVAADLGVIRQTVYRQFPSVDELFVAVGTSSVESFVDDLSRHLRRRTDPADFVIESLATTIEWLPERPYLTLLLDTGRSGRFNDSVTSSSAATIALQVFERAPIDWAEHGFSDQDLAELVELTLRIVQSMLISPPDPPRSPRALRTFLRRWLGPGLRPT